MQRLSNLRDYNDIFLTTTGLISRRLYNIQDLESNFYMVGSMGCVSSIALGLAISGLNKNIIAIDGDGALLMRMGAMATNAAYGTNNMLHILLDNGMHESTGGQLTVSNNVDFVGIAASVGYRKSIYVHDLKELEKYFLSWKKNPKLTFLYLKTKSVKEKLDRPKINPEENKIRLMKFLGIR